MFGVEAFQVGNTEVQAIVRQLLEDLLGTQGREFEAQVRMLPVQALQQRQRIEARQRHHTQSQRTDQTAATGGRLGV
ncbi:hypothetical protein PS726_04807 [Pseudomonas fluorescens]|nr:hypothetical protein PS726_04807 [Pseudomonas fluorescens]